MKTIFRFLALAVLLTTFSAVAVTTSYAQDAAAEKKALYDTHLANYAANDADKLQVALGAAKTYIEKFGTSADDKEQVAYYTKEVTRLEQRIKDVGDEVKRKNDAAANDKLLNRFDAAVKGTNNIAAPSETYAAGKDIVALNNDFQLDVLLVLGSVGFDQASAATAVDTYNNETIQYAKAAIQKLEANATSKTKNYGVYGYSYKTDKFADGKPNPNGFADGKSNALGAMNYNIGYILYYRQGKDDPAKKREALPYLYKAAQYNSYTKKNPTLYQTIGAWYLDEAIRIDKERTAKLKANDNKDNDETLAMVGEQKGYADRAIDAYSRAYKLAKANPKSGKPYTDNLYSRLTDLYKFRYDGDTKGIDAFVATVDSKPFPDPTTAVTPVKVEPTEPKTTTSTTDPTKPATAPVTTKPATTPVATPTKPATGATKPAGTATVEAAATEGKTGVKKVAPKKKGTR